MKYFTELWNESKQKFTTTQYKNRAEWTAEQLLIQESEESSRWIPVEEDLPEELIETKEVKILELKILKTDYVLVKCEDKRFNLVSYHVAWRYGSIDKKNWRWQSDSVSFNSRDIIGWRRIESL